MAENYAIHEGFHEKNYKKSYFLNYEKPIDSFLNEEKSAYIIELGFILFFIISILVNKKSIGSVKEDEEDLENLENMKEGSIDKGVVGNLLSNITILNQGLSFGKSFLNTGFEYAKKFKKNVVAIATDSPTAKQKADQEEKDKYNSLMQFKFLKTRALEFYKKHSAHIEIFRYNKFYKLYFPLLPECINLPKTIKREFHEKVNRNSVKTKVSGLMDEADYIINVIIHEQRLKNIFNQSKLLGIIATYEKLWENLAFYINLTLNFIIIASYSENNAPIGEDIEYYRLFQPQLFSLSALDTLRLFKILGILNLVFSSLAVLLFFMKRGPLFTNKIWKDLKKKLSIQKYGCIKKVLFYFKACLDSFRACLTDFNLLFYILYIIFIILGLSIHPFFYAFHLTDFLRISILKNVLRAIWNPKTQIFLTLVFFVLVEYYFSIISYTFFYDHYFENDTIPSRLLQISSVGQNTGSKPLNTDNGGLTYENITNSSSPNTEIVHWRCNTLWKCFFSTYDFTFKVIYIYICKIL